MRDGRRIYILAQGRLPGVRALLPGTEDKLRRLLLIVPFYSIESWLYQNTAEAEKIYQEHYLGPDKDLDLLSQWGADRGLLDEVDQPKERLRIRDKYNLRLATQHYPVQAVKNAGKSFCHTIEVMRGCDELAGALAATRVARAVD